VQRHAHRTICLLIGDLLHRLQHDDVRQALPETDAPIVGQRERRLWWTLRTLAQRRWIVTLEQSLAQQDQVLQRDQRRRRRYPSPEQRGDLWIGVKCVECWGIGRVEQRHALVHHDPLV
jgi:hypothetical protein